MLIKEIMHSEIKSCSAETYLDAVALEMWNNDCGAIPIVDPEYKPIGIVTDRDIAMVSALQHKPLWEIQSIDIAQNRTLYTCKIDDDIFDALESMKTHRIRCLPVVDEHGQLVGILSMDDLISYTENHERTQKTALPENTTATALKALADHAQEKDESAEQAHVRQSQFLNTFVHELRNPLTPIQNAVALLDHVASDNPLLGEVKNIIKRQVSHMLRLLNSILDLARVDTGKLVLDFQKIDLGQFVDEALMTYSPVFANRRQCVKKSLAAGIFIEADPVRLGQILNNLLDNAAKYTPVSGVINISVAATESGAELKISDNGIGISVDALPNIFNIYLQDAEATAFNSTGLGIGLSVVKELTTAHHGDIIARSDGPGKGSEFIITLPRIQLKNGETKVATTTNFSATAKLKLLPFRKSGASILELPSASAVAKTEIALLKEELNEANKKLIDMENVCSANEKLLTFGLRLQAEMDIAYAMLQKAVDTMKDDVQTNANQRREFLSGISHELRTPLNSVLGFGQLMLHDDNNQQYLQLCQRERLNGILRATQQLLGLADNLFCTAPKNQTERDITLKSVEILDVIGATLTNLEDKRRERGIQWQWRLAEPCSVLADAAALQRALQSVIAYAIANSAKGDMLTGSLHRESSGVSILIKCRDRSISKPSITGSSRFAVERDPAGVSDLAQPSLDPAKTLLKQMQAKLIIHRPIKDITVLQITLKSESEIMPNSASKPRI